MLIANYCLSASKFGVKGFGEALAADLDRLGMTRIHVSTIYPGIVDTPMITTLDSVDVVLGLIYKDGILQKLYLV